MWGPLTWLLFSIDWADWPSGGVDTSPWRGWPSWPPSDSAPSRPREPPTRSSRCRASSPRRPTEEYVARALITRFLSAPASGSFLTPPERLADLTPREREVTVLAAEGRSNEQIAEHLVLSVLTVRTHVQRAMTKPGARDRAQPVVIAYRTGLVRPRSGPR